MKSMKDYIYAEKTIYENIMTNSNDILQEVLQIEPEKLASYEAIVIFTTGSSSNAALAALPYMASKLQIPIYVEEPSSAANYMLYLNSKTLYFAISQGGHSYSTIHIVEKIEKSGGTVFTLTGDTSSPIAKKAKHVISMGMEVEEMPYVTAGYSAIILILMLTALKIAERTQKISEKAYQEADREIKEIPDYLPDVIAKAETWIKKHETELMQAQRMIFIGYGGAYGVAREGETKVTETIRMTAFGKELEEYMHGPYIGLEKDDWMLFIEPHGTLEDRANRLKEFLNSHVKTVRTLYADGLEAQVEADDLSLGIQTNEYLTPLFMTIPIHLLAYTISQKKKVNLEISAYPQFDAITRSKI